MSSSRGIGIIGLGGIALNHLDAYRTRGFRVVAGHDVNAAIFDRVRREFGVTRLTTNLDEFLDTPGLDVVDVAVPHYIELRRPIFQAVARAGKALFCQKPLDETYAGALELTRIAEDAGIPFAVNQNAPFVPGFRIAEKILRDPDRFGAPFWFQIENRGALWFDSHPHWGTRDRWIMCGMAVHHLALAHAWFGPPAKVWATLAHDPSKPQIRAENISVVGLEYASGLKGFIINNWSYTGPRPKGHPEEEIIVLGARGSLTLDSRTIVFDPAKGERETLTADGTWFNDAFGESMRAFLASLDGGPPHPSSGRADLEVMAVLESAFRSASSGASVSPSSITS
jgi:myo-inositol 2-dehydrogenase/D-chiro-inositol 1-dehydrogenase